jgi:hypothetical protein
MAIVRKLSDIQEKEGSMRNPFNRIAEAFILTFGITRPRPENERVATIFIVSLLFGTVCFAVAMGILFIRQLL